MGQESLEYLERMLAECEYKCEVVCGMKYNHLFENSPFSDGSIPGCQNSIRKAALKRVIEKRKLKCQV